MAAKIQQSKAVSCVNFIWFRLEPHTLGDTSGYSSAYCNFFSPSFSQIQNVLSVGLFRHLTPLLTRSLGYFTWLPMSLLSSERPVETNKQNFR